MRVISALILFCLTGSIVYAATITGTAYVNANPNPVPPAGKKAVYVKGDWTKMPAEEVEKIEATFYVKDNNGNLVSKGSVTDPNFANGKYQTTEWVADQGVTYTVITRIHVKNQMGEPVATITSITP